MAGFKKGPWSKEEDAILLDWVAAYGAANWSCIHSKGLLMRTGKSCRIRWLNKLKPGLKKGRKFSPEEEEKVVELQAQLGNKWAQIARTFPGRTDNDVKNFWSTRKKRLARSQRDPLSSIPKSETGMHGPELIVPANEVHVYETPTDDQQQDKAMTSDHHENTAMPYQCFEATSATPVLTKPTNTPCNTKTAVPSAPFNDIILHGLQQQYLNVTSATPLLTSVTSYPHTKSEPSSVPLYNIMPHQSSLNCTSAAPVPSAPTLDTPSIKGLAQSSLLSTPRSGTGMGGPELVFPTNETPTNNQQQDKAMTSDHHKNMALPYIHRCLEATSATPVLTGPTNNPWNTKTAVPSAPFNDIMLHGPCQQYLNATSATPRLTSLTSYPPNKKSEPSSVPFDSIMPHQPSLNWTSATHVPSALTVDTQRSFIAPFNNMTTHEVPPLDSIMPHQQSLNWTSATPVPSATTLDIPSINSRHLVAHFNDMTPQIQSPFSDCLFDTEFIFSEPDFRLSVPFHAPSVFDDLTDSLLEFFEQPHLPAP